MASSISMDGLLTTAISAAVDGLRLDYPENSSGCFKYTCSVCKEGTSFVYSCSKAECQCKAFTALLKKAKDTAGTHWWVCPKASLALLSRVETFVLEKARKGDDDRWSEHNNHTDDGYNEFTHGDDYYDYVCNCKNYSCSGDCGVLMCGCIDTCRGKCVPRHKFKCPCKDVTCDGCGMLHCGCIDVCRNRCGTNPY
jgi:hypothetical protein